MKKRLLAICLILLFSISIPGCKSTYEKAEERTSNTIKKYQQKKNDIDEYQENQNKVTDDLLDDEEDTDDDYTY